MDPIEASPLWQQENVTLNSVGIDIGSSGTQVIFSRLRLQRRGADLATRYVVVERDCTYRSPVSFTPFGAGNVLDAERLGRILDDAYAAARQQPDGVDTGAVILTGEAVRRHNAEAIAAVVADRAGDFVCATAGHHMEATLAAYGSGAAAASAERTDRILNVDIGGGTTKLAVLDSGRVVATAAVHIGGRLQVVDGSGRLIRIEDAGRDHAARAGRRWSLGDTVTPADLDAVAETMADALVAAVTPGPVRPDIARLYLTDPVTDFGGVAGVMFSGGVAEYVYQREERDFGDLGRRLGTAIRHRLADGRFPYPLLPAGECIRATALGAAQHSVQLSGTTCYISDPDRLLPRRNLQVVRPTYRLDAEVDGPGIAAAIRAHLAAFDLDATDDPSDVDVAVALRWAGPPSYRRLAAFASAIERALGGRTARGRPIVLALDGDVALSLGTILRDELRVATDLLIIDGLWLADFDYIDVGRVRRPSNVVPVTIKSLLFR